MDCLGAVLWAGTVFLGFLAGCLYGYHVGRGEGGNGGPGGAREPAPQRDVRAAL